jgi:hypothetical protein
MEQEDAMITNSIILKALEEEEGNPDSPWGEAGACRPFVEAATKANVEAAKIYAAIKTGRILTADNVKLLGEDDLAEWEMFCEEYDELARHEPQ